MLGKEAEKKKNQDEMNWLTNLWTCSWVSWDENKGIDDIG